MYLIPRNAGIGGSSQHDKHRAEESWPIDLRGDIDGQEPTECGAGVGLIFQAKVQPVTILIRFQKSEVHGRKCQDAIQQKRMGSSDARDNNLMVMMGESPLGHRAIRLDHVVVEKSHFQHP